jgi:hypothetical protein
MATVKLKDVLKSLPQDTSLTGSEMVVINDNGENKYIPYSTIRNGLVNASERKTLANTAEWLIAHDNVTTIDALNKELDAFGAETAQGLHRIKCFGIPLFVTFANLNVDSSVFMQTIQGSITFNSTKTNIASINTVGNLTIAVRYYQGGKWGTWNTPMAQIKPPTVQTSSNGTTKNYIYSTGTDADKNCVASCNWWIYSENGRVYVRWKRWGADNNTHYDHDNEEHQTSQYMLPYMGIDNGACYQDGLLPWQWGQRMKDCGINFRFIREELSTAEYVNLRYLNFANGGAYDTPISKATSAKAGVMTAADKTLLSALGGYLHPVTDNLTTLDALNTKLNGMGASTGQGTHYFKCFGIPLTVTLSVLNVDKKVLMQTITGSITLNADNTALGSINGTGNYTTAVRYYQNSKWGKWSMPLNPPTAQTGASGTKTSYIYSAGSDQDTKTLITSKFWIYPHNDRNQFLRFKHWGANNDTAEENYSQVMLPNAWTGGNGLLRYDIYSRLDAFALREQNSTATEVKIITPIFTTGGTRELSISAATTAKAGVMTAADRELLNKIKAKLGL